MLAHHYLEALELAEVAGLDSAGLGESARHALRDAGDRASSLYALEAAERLYDAALRLWPEDDPERAQLLFRRAAPVGNLDGGDPERLAEARDALLAAGDAPKAAEAEMLLSMGFWMLGRRELGAEHAGRAAALIADAPPSRSTAWVIARMASRASIEGDNPRAIELVSEARAQAEGLGWEEGLSEALSLLGLLRVYLGDRHGLDDVERGVEMARNAGAFGVLLRAHNTLAVAHQVLGDLDAGYAARLDGARLAGQIGAPTDARWFQGVLADHHYRRGEWDEAMRMADEYLGAIEAGSPHYNAFQDWVIRAQMRAARGDFAGAMRDAESGLAAGRALADPQAVYFVLPACANIFSLAGEHDRAVPLVRELIEALESGLDVQFAVINFPVFAAAARHLGLEQEVLAALADYAATPWTDAVRAYGQRDFAAAAEILRRIGTRPDEAEARLRAAEELVAQGRRAEADEQLQQALAFYRSVGATRYVRECEALLPASA